MTQQKLPHRTNKSPPYPKPARFAASAKSAGGNHELGKKGHTYVPPDPGQKRPGSCQFVQTPCLRKTADDRMRRFCHIVKIKSHTAKAAEEGPNKRKERYGDSFARLFRSITADNGSEFARLTEQLPETALYYTHPYSAWERATNEKQNSLIRRFFPKGTSFDDIPDSALARVEARIHHLPRKIFNYHCSDFIFHNVLFDIAI